MILNQQLSQIGVMEFVIFLLRDELHFLLQQQRQN